MKKLLLTLLFLTSTLLASDELNIDNLFKKQIGLRSITSFSLLSTGNANTYSLYPNISIGGDTTLWDDTKQLSLNQAFIYTLMPKFDILVSGSGSYTRKEYTNVFTSRYSSQNNWQFNSLWLGFIYTGKSIADFIPQITFQTAIIQRESSATEDKKASTLNPKVSKQP